jgi:hypothetical protein
VQVHSRRARNFFKFVLERHRLYIS